jgi:hypothetical protein
VLHICNYEWYSRLKNEVQHLKCCKHVFCLCQHGLVGGCDIKSIYENTYQHDLLLYPIAQSSKLRTGILCDFYRQVRYRTNEAMSQNMLYLRHIL